MILTGIGKVIELENTISSSQSLDFQQAYLFILILQFYKIIYLFSLPV